MKHIVFLGDVFLPNKFEARVGDLGSYCINLEAPITDCAEGTSGKINLKASQNHLRDTFGAEPTAVCLANNHIMDYGPRGYRDTIDNLRGRGVCCYGAGTLEENVNNPVIFESGSVCCALAGYVCPSTSPAFAGRATPGVAPPEYGRIKSDIQTARKAGAKRIIVSIHWGVENVELPRPVDIGLAHKIVDLGADAVIGHHAHCIQPWESYRGKPIFYGLGNCLMPPATVPSAFANGKPISWSKLSYFAWNRRSLAVAYNPTDGSCRSYGLEFDGSTLRYGKKEEPPRLRIGNPIRYRLRYQLGFVFGKYRFALARFCRHPHWPKHGTLSNPFGIKGP
jgi:poly-gamma-glutamate synthesis protein (capsule biosynthesis protein)